MFAMCVFVFHVFNGSYFAWISFRWAFLSEVTHTRSHCEWIRPAENVSPIWNAMKCIWLEIRVACKLFTSWPRTINMRSSNACTNRQLNALSQFNFPALAISLAFSCHTPPIRIRITRKLNTTSTTTTTIREEKIHAERLNRKKCSPCDLSKCKCHNENQTKKKWIHFSAASNVNSAAIAFFVISMCYCDILLHVFPLFLERLKFAFDFENPWNISLNCL